MLPDPLHPALVHFPIVLMVLLPLAAGGALWLIRRGTVARRAWLLPLACAGALSLSAWLAAQAGEAQEEKVERVVPEAALETHAEAADRFVLLSLGVLGVLALGLARGRLGGVARGAGTVAAVALVAAGYQVGRSGGALVYRHGAAAAYGSAAPAVGSERQGEVGDRTSVRQGDRERDDDDR